MDLKIEEINKDNIEIIKELWDSLRIMHKQNSTYHKDFFDSMTFEKRITKFMEIENENIKIDVLKNNNLSVGYCISTVIGAIGELDSLFIAKEFRKYKFGYKLVQNSTRWLKSKQCEKIQVAVAQGHESVFGFYEKFGFYPRVTVLTLEDV
ncbi:MAG: GNAT family N-acetyltransferase [Spirochaetaceae bacterium]